METESLRRTECLALRGSNVSFDKRVANDIASSPAFDGLIRTRGKTLYRFNYEIVNQQPGSFPCYNVPGQFQALLQTPWGEENAQYLYNKQTVSTHSDSRLIPVYRIGTDTCKMFF